MYIDGSLTNPVWCLFDQRTINDFQLAENGVPGQHVYRKSPLFRATFKDSIKDITRIALFDARVKATAGQKREGLDILRSLVAKHGPERILVFPTLSKAMAKSDESMTGTTVCWQAFDMPASMDDMRGTLHLRRTSRITAMYPCSPIVDETFKVMNQRWAMGAVNNVSTPKPTHMLTQVDEAVVGILRSMSGQDLAIDIETIDSKNVITAINLAAGGNAVSMPWDRYQPSKLELEEEPSIEFYGQLGATIKAEMLALMAAPTRKILHNGMYDIVRLKARGIAVGGSLEDTLAMHAIMYPTLRHGLQHAAASVFPTPAWKSEHKAPFAKSDERFWIYEPAALREYGAQDAFFTLKLWEGMKGFII